MRPARARGAASTEHMSRPLQVKVCGMRESDNILALATNPSTRPDLMGLIFYPKSSRYVADGLSPEVLASLSLGLPLVGVFVNATPEAISEAVSSYDLSVLQLHGDESPAFCEQIRAAHPGLGLWKALGVGPQTDFAVLEAYAPCCDAFLFDTKALQYGGTGRRFDWSLLTGYEGATPYMLAGGIGASSVEDVRALAANDTRLLGIDLNSQVECAPGRKSPEAVAEILKELRP